MSEEHIIQTVSDYVNWTETTAIYPRESMEKARDYEILGAYSEIGEVCGMLKRELRDPDYTLERLQLKLELGDIAWYLARLHYEHVKEDGDLNDLLKEIGVTIPESKNCFSMAHAVWEYFGPIAKDDGKLIYEIAGISFETMPSVKDAMNRITEIKRNVNEKEAGKIKLILELSEDYKKPIGMFMSDFADEIFCSMGLVKWMILCDRFRFDPLDVMRANYRKLEDRKERNKLHGSGDTR
jgi:hypothetical protein